jgi:uncharacterized protein (TIGR03437 family)
MTAFPNLTLQAPANNLLTKEKCAMNLPVVSAKRWIILLLFGLLGSAGLLLKSSAAAGRAESHATANTASLAANEELLTDDGTVESAITGDNLLCVNRLTPTSYPATLQTIRIFFVRIPNLPDPTGAQIKLFAFAGAAGTTQPPSNPTFLVNQTVTIPTLPANGGFIDFSIQNGPTINSGDFYVGFQAPNPAGGVLFAADRSGSQQQRAFATFNEGQTWNGPLTLTGGIPINLMMRAIVINNAQPVPRISVPSVLPFGSSVLGATQEQTLTVSNTGNAPLIITAVTSNNAQFTLAPLTLPLTIPAGGQAQIVVRFAAASAGAQNGTLTITSNDPTRPTVNVGLSGVGGSPSNTATVFINSGASQTGSIAAPPAGAGLLYAVQYGIFVPTGATQLKIDLTGTQDLDLFVRFGQRVAITGGSLLADYRSNSAGVGGTESITVTPSSSPPLQSGLYFIAIANFGPGAANFNLAATVTGGTAPGAVATVSAASYSGTELASGSIAASFGTNLATGTQAANTLPLPTNLAGTTISVRDNLGIERLAPLFFVSPTQANFQIPPGASNGTAFLTITSGNGAVSTGTLQIANVAPGLFTANVNGQGVATALALRIKGDGSQSFEPVARFDAAQSRFVPVPIDLGPTSDQVFLVLYGTGIRGRSSLSAVAATIGGSNVQVTFAGEAPGFVGLDQVNLGPIPRSLIGRGDVNIVLQVDGKTANTVVVNIK